MKNVSKKTKTIIAVILVLAIIGSFIKSPKSEVAASTNKVTPVLSDKPWEQKTYEEKQTWIEAKLKATPDDKGYAFISKMNHAIKNEFKFPEEVSFDNWGGPVLSNGRVVDADNGIVFIDGSCSAKNAFGVKSRFNYSIKIIVTPGVYEIEKVSVSEQK